MVSSDLGACEWFVWDLRRSGLIDRGQLDQVVGDYLKRLPRAEPPALAEYLVTQNILSPFQAERILGGKTQGLVLGPYVLVDAIGAGSMGQVYKATSKTDNQSYAVKVLPRRSMWNVRLARRQVRSFAQFNHSAIVPFIDVGTSGGQHYLVWPLAEGETLENRIARQGRLPVDAGTAIMSQVAQGLAVAHQHGLFHGLLKPSNILIGGDGQARLLDFGIGSLLAENDGESLVDTMSTANTLTSGLDCSSPESIMEPTNRTQAGDQYSFGCVLYYCLAGRYPFADGTAVEKMMAHQFKQPTPLREVVSNVPDGIVAVLDRLMQKAPESRYLGMEEVVEALAPYTGDLLRRATGFGSSHGLGGGSSRSGGSNFGSRFGTPIPASSPGVAAASAAAQVQTPVGSPLTPIPTARFESRPAPVRSSIPTLKPSAQARPAPEVSRATIASPSSHGYDERSLPVAQAVEEPLRPPQQLPTRSGGPQWDEPKKSGGISVFMVFLIAALVTAGVYLLGKNFLFPS